MYLEQICLHEIPAVVYNIVLKCHVSSLQLTIVDQTIKGFIFYIIT